MFLISTIGVATFPCGVSMCRFTFASTRRLPSCMLQSDTPMYVSSNFSSFRNALASAELRMSGSETISKQRRAGAIQIDEAVALAGYLIVQLLPASSSRCARRMRTRFGSNRPSDR